MPRIPGGLEREALRREAHEALAPTGLGREDIDRLADTLAAVGELVFETSVFSVDGSDGPSMFVLSPADDASARGVEQLIRELAE